VDDFGDDFGLTAKLSDRSIDPAAVVAYMQQALTVLLQHMDTASTTALSELSIITEQENHQLLEVFNATEVSYPKDKTIVDLFQQQVSKTPDAIAVVYQEASLSYKALDQRSNQLARYLITKGIQPDDLVGICLDRSLELLVGILGILKSGGAYVPIDPEYPKARIDYMMEDSGVKVLLSTTECSAFFSDRDDLELVLLDSDWNSIIGKHALRKLKRVATPNDLAYVIYTSGSTGQPKGVMIAHKNVSNLLYSQTNYFQITAKDRFLAFSSFSFDASVEQMYLSLLNGAILHIVPKDILLDVQGVTKLLVDKKITHLHAVPSFLRELPFIKGSSLKRIISGGDVFDSEIFKNWGNKSVRVINEFGPTETTVTSSQNEVKKATIPHNIGQPIANTQIYIVNPDNKVVPTAVVGELCIGGAGLARGYLNQKALTKERFVANPFKKGERIYKTGDLARWLPDGTVEFIGRKDTQVKIRGYRIELGEIENALSLLPKVQQSCVLAREDGHGS
ncbi:MAG: amino acid adenylation domain-containing protein, partial [Bacteroidota bacterium]